MGSHVINSQQNKKTTQKTPKGGADSLPENTEIPKLKSKPAGATQLMPRLSQSELLQLEHPPVSRTGDRAQ